MKRRHWSPSQKADIVIQGLQGRPVSEICLEYQICQTQYYQWRDQFLTNRTAAFETGKSSKTEQRLKLENQKLRACVAQLTLEVKKSEW